MSSLQKVTTFLQEFKQKMKIWDVLFRDDRGKNSQTLSELELRPIEGRKVPEDLKVEDYSQGPLEEMLYGGSDMWVFGKTVKSREVYIKITMGMQGASVICISFHLSEHKLNYPLKTN